MTPNVAFVSEDEDLGKTGVVLQFRRSIKSDNTEIEARRRSAIDKGFMRFGRSQNALHFANDNVNDLEHDDEEINEPYQMRMRKAGGNVLRFGKRGNMLRFGKRGNMLRFGRNYLPNSDVNSDVDYANNNDASEVYDLVEPPSAYKRNPESKYDEHGKKILRLGRSSSESYSDESANDYPLLTTYYDKSNEREKKPTDGNVLRFGKRDKGNIMRFGRGGNMLRFGRGGNMLRFGRGNNMMRFGRSEKNMMRFGKRNYINPQEISQSSKVVCEDNNCVFQENEQRILDGNDFNGEDNMKKDQLNSLFGDETNQAKKMAEYVLKK
jgi:hypothetical protein